MTEIAYQYLFHFLSDLIHPFFYGRLSVFETQLNIILNRFFFRFVCCVIGAEAATSQAEIERHLELGKDFLARGQLGDALTHYHAAVGMRSLY